MSKEAAESLFRSWRDGLSDRLWPAISSGSSSPEGINDWEHIQNKLKIAGKTVNNIRLPLLCKDRASCAKLDLLNHTISKWEWKHNQRYLTRRRQPSITWGSRSFWTNQQAKAIVATHRWLPQGVWKLQVESMSPSHSPCNTRSTHKIAHIGGLLSLPLLLLLEVMHLLIEVIGDGNTLSISRFNPPALF